METRRSEAYATGGNGITPRLIRADKSIPIQAMKSIIILTILIASALIYLTSCRSGQGSGPPPTSRAKATPRGFPRPYYRSDAEGSYYFSRGEETNSNYRPTVTRTVP
jgi:hypothetical protein